MKGTAARAVDNGTTSAEQSSGRSLVLAYAYDLPHRYTGHVFPIPSATNALQATSALTLVDLATGHPASDHIAFAIYSMISRKIH